VPCIEPDATRVLVTGATGRIGRVVVVDLLARGYRVRATSSKPQAELNASTDALEWQSFDFMAATDYDGLVAGCDAIVHLAAELGEMERMPKVNLDATRGLAQAAERAGVKALCYISSVSVYGSGQARVMTEDSPVLTVEHDIRSEYWARDFVRMYGRTKLAGERAIADAACKVRSVILRPTVVVDIHQIVGIRDWSMFERNLRAHRHAHHVYVWDVSGAIIWAVERTLNGAGAPGSVETFNLSEDEFAEPTYAEFMSKAFAVSKDPRFRIFKVPGLADWLLHILRFHSLPLRDPIWRMRFPNDRLRAAGFRLRFGMEKANALALDTLRRESNSEIRSHARG
jgi:nucleoside-diphosphate-sugar epimerase